MIIAKASLSCDRSFIVQATVITIVIYDQTVITIVNYDGKAFIVQANGLVILLVYMIVE